MSRQTKKPTHRQSYRTFDRIMHFPAQINDSCFILIAPFDLIGRGMYRYTFEGVCRECPDLWLEDGAVKIFINTLLAVMAGAAISFRVEGLLQ